MCEEIGRLLRLPVHYLCVRNICLLGQDLVIGATAGTFDEVMLDDELIKSLRVPQETVLESLQIAKREAVSDSLVPEAEFLWNNVHKSVPWAKPEPSEILLVDPAITSKFHFKVAVECALRRPVTSVIPVSPYVFRPAVLDAPTHVRTGVYLRELNDLALLQAAARASPNAKG